MWLCRKGGVQAAYRNDQRQEYVNNLAYKLGTGLGTAPWYGVPGTAYDFRHSHSAGPTYHTDASSPKGYGYQASVPQYHSQPSYGHSGGGYGGPAHKSGVDAKPTGSCGGYAEPQTKIADTALLAAKKAAPYASMVDEGGYEMPIKSKGYTDDEQGHSANHGKVGYDGMAKHAGYVAGRYETLGYGYMYWIWRYAAWPGVVYSDIIYTSDVYSHANASKHRTVAIYYSSRNVLMAPSGELIVTMTYSGDSANYLHTIRMSREWEMLNCKVKKHEWTTHLVLFTTCINQLRITLQRLHSNVDLRYLQIQLTTWLELQFQWRHVHPIYTRVCLIKHARYKNVSTRQTTVSRFNIAHHRPFIINVGGVNLARILRGCRADPEGLAGAKGEVWGAATLPSGEGCAPTKKFVI